MITMIVAKFIKIEGYFYLTDFAIHPKLIFHSNHFHNIIIVH
jgi:hypothetical protein